MKFALFQALRVMDDVRHDDPQIVKRRHKKMEKQKICPRVDIRKKVDLFSHLPQYQIGGGLLSSDWEAGKHTPPPNFFFPSFLFSLLAFYVMRINF